jgi:Uma2 family endonuclease
MTATATAPLTATELRERFSETDELVWIPASKEEYWSLIAFPEFRIEYYENQIVGTMSYGAFSHETIIDNLSWLFNTQLDRKNFRCFGSNRPVYVEQCDDIFEPDLHVVQGEVDLYHYKKTKTATSNPSVIVEVFSKSTKDFDINNKLPCYKTMSSLQHIIFVEQDKPYITVYTRTKRPNEWLNADYFDLSQRMRIMGKYFSLSDIYDKVIFRAK